MCAAIAAFSSAAGHTAASGARGGSGGAASHAVQLAAAMQRIEDLEEVVVQIAAALAHVDAKLSKVSGPVGSPVQAGTPLYGCAHACAYL